MERITDRLLYYSKGHGDYLAQFTEHLNSRMYYNVP